MKAMHVVALGLLAVAVLAGQGVSIHAWTARAALDSDGDGFDDAVEDYIGTDPLDGCPDDPSDDAWPYDNNIDTWSDVLDILQYKGHLQICVPDPGYVQRLDLNADGCVNVLDVVLYKGHLQVQCTNPPPPSPTPSPSPTPTGPIVSIESGEIFEGSSEVIRLWALDVGDPPLCGFTIDIDYDPEVKVPTDCVADPAGNFAIRDCAEDYEADGVAPDTVRVIGGTGAAGGMTGDIPLADITWSAVGSGGDSTTLDVQVVEFLNCTTPPVAIPGVTDADGVNVIVGPTPTPTPTPTPGCDPGVDTDGDGFDNDVECYVGTDPLDDCPDDPWDDAWPFDNNVDTWSNVLDVLQYKGHLQICVPDPGYVQRLDINGDQCVNALDVLLYKGHLQIQCTNP